MAGERKLIWRGQNIRAKKWEFFMERSFVGTARVFRSLIFSRGTTADELEAPLVEKEKVSRCFYRPQKLGGESICPNLYVQKWEGVCVWVVSQRLLKGILL